MARADRVKTQDLKLSQCPACKGDVWGTATFSVTLGSVELVDGKPEAKVETVLTGFKVRHECGGMDSAPGEDIPNL